MQGAIEAFEGAVARDPGFARAYAELAQAYSILPMFDPGSSAEVVQKALFAAQRALALDSTLSSAHAAMGSIYNREWRWREARSALERARTLDSSDVAAAQWLAENYLASGDARRAAALLTEVTRREPRASMPLARLAVAQSVSGQRDLAIETARRAVALDSTAPGPRVVLASALVNAGRAAEAVRELERLSPAERESPLVQGTLGYAYARAGRQAEALAITALLEARSQRSGTYPALAKVYLGLGETDKALDALTWATAARDEFFTSESLASPVFDSVRADPRFARVIDIIGLDSAALTRAR